MSTLTEHKIAILSTDGFEQSELMQPLEKLRSEGATVHVVSPKSGSIKGWDEDNWGESVPVDTTLDDASASDYDALVLPGGVINPDQLRTNADALNFIRSFFLDGKPVAAICHGPWTLINAGAVEGRLMTSYPSIRVDLENAGAHWVDEEVVVDQALITSRNPDDLPAFIDKIIEEVREGAHEKQKEQFAMA
ncbi:MAG: type 1 glutamine amidotransferase domain-containing protein [Rhodothermales bacterium]